MAKPKQITVGGIKWRLAEVEWEDAYTATRAPVSLITNKKICGPSVKSWGYTAKVGGYQLILSELNTQTEQVDVTVVPVRPKVSIRYV